MTGGTQLFIEKHIDIAIKNNCTPIEVIQNYCRKNLESKSDTIRLTNLIIESLN